MHLARFPRVRLFPACIYRKPVDWKGSIGDGSMQFRNDDSIRSIAPTPSSRPQIIVVYNELPLVLQENSARAIEIQ